MQLRSSVCTSLPRQAGRKQVVALAARNNNRTVSIVTEPPPPVQASESPSVSMYAGGVALVAAAYVAWTKMTGRSLRGEKAMYYADVMKTVNTINMESLSDDQVLAARARRSKERGNHTISLEDIELPDNHPWATRNKVTDEDEKAIRARIHLRKGVRPRAPTSTQDPSRQTISISKSDLDAHRATL
eukprot:gene5241-18472_t